MNKKDDNITTLIRKSLKEGVNVLDVVQEENELYRNYKTYGISKERFLEIYKEESAKVYNAFKQKYPKLEKKLVKNLE